MTEREHAGVELQRSEPETVDWLEVLRSDPKIVAWLELEPEPSGLSSFPSSHDRPSQRARKSTKIELLRTVPLFAGCSRRELSALAPLVDELDVPEGKTLIREGERGLEFFVIVEGTAGVTQNGRKLRDLDSGDWAGEIALITDLPRTATVATTSPGRLLVLTDQAFRSVLEHTPSIALKLMRPLAERLYATAI